MRRSFYKALVCFGHVVSNVKLVHITLDAKIWNQLKMWQPQCLSCQETLNQVSVPAWARLHIIDRHYLCAGYEDIDEERSWFFEDVLPSHMLFTTVINELRSGWQVSHIQDTNVRIARHYKFGFVIGVYPNRQGGFPETDTIKIVFNTTECQECNHRCPSEVVTIYPCKPRQFTN